MFREKGGFSYLTDPQLSLNLLQRHALRLRNHRLHPKQLENHDAGKERENVTGREGGDHPREKSREQGGKDPMREAAKGLTFCAMAIGEYLGDKDPNHCALADRVSSDECKNAYRHD